MKKISSDYNSIIKCYNYEHRRSCNIIIVYMLEDKDYRSVNIDCLNDKIKKFSFGGKISAIKYKIKDSYAFE